MNKRDLKILLENYYLLALNNCKKDYSHIMIVESIKSIVGINLNKSSSNLILWLERYMDNLNNDTPEYVSRALEIPEVISYKNLEQNIVDKELNKAYKSLYYLKSVSDGIQIVEFLLELSLKYSPSIASVIWSIYRMEMFLSRKFLNKSLEVCVEAIINNMSNEVQLINKNVNWEDYLKSSNDKIFIYYSIYHTPLIRSNSINKLIISNLEVDGDLKFDSFEYENLKDQEEQGRDWILNYFENLPMNIISPKLILDTDRIRSCLKLAQTDEEKLILWSQFNRLIYDFK